MPEPGDSIKATVGPLLTAGVAAAGTTLLFPTAAATVGFVPVAGAASTLVIPAVIGGVAGWFAGKAMFENTSGASELKLPVERGVTPSDAPEAPEPGKEMQKEWQKSEAQHRAGNPPHRER